jgi:hypothetical protein
MASGRRERSAGVATSDQTMQNSTPMAVKRPKRLTGWMSEVRKERKPIAVVREVRTTGRASSPRMRRSASEEGSSAGR